MSESMGTQPFRAFLSDIAISRPFRSLSKYPLARPQHIEALVVGVRGGNCENGQ